MGSGISFQDQENLNIQIVTAVVNGIIHSRVKNDFPCCNGKKKKTSSSSFLRVYLRFIIWTINMFTLFIIK